MAIISPVPRRWDARAIPDLHGKRFLVTGGNSGLGFETVRALAAHGGEVIMASRDLAKAEVATSRIRGNVVIAQLDLADLSSIETFTREFTWDRLDALILNAGVMATPLRHTVDGFELQIGTNHLGHFALGARLLHKLGGARVVSVSSMAHRMADFDQSHLKEQIWMKGDDALEYNAWRTYGRTKLANLLFTHELQRRSDAAGWGITALAAHPGWSNTNLQMVAPEMKGQSVATTASSLVNKVFAQSAAMGALPTLAAALLPSLPGGTYLGPDGLGEMRGYPKLVRAREIAYDPRLAGALWGISEDLTGLSWRVLFEP